MYIFSFFLQALQVVFASCISPPAPLGVFQGTEYCRCDYIILKLSTATSDGASSFSAFDHSSAYTFCLQHYYSQQYRTLKFDPFRLFEHSSTVALYLSNCSISRPAHGFSTQPHHHRALPQKACFRQSSRQSTACPRPSVPFDVQTERLFYPTLRTAHIFCLPSRSSIVSSLVCLIKTIWRGVLTA